MVNNNYLILLAFISSITSISRLAILEIPPCSLFPGTDSSLRSAVGAAERHGRAASAGSPVAAL
jgi:hypothetical protein